MMVPADYIGSALPRSATVYEEIAETINVPVISFRAFLLTEVASESGFTEYGWPQELFERHKFRKITLGRHDNIPEISNANRGGYLKQPAEHARLMLATELDPTGAMLSTSWGMWQLMGFNFQLCGYDGVEAFVEAMCQSEDLQLWAGAKFLVSTGIAEDLHKGKLVDAIKAYNGSGNVTAYLAKYRANLARVSSIQNHGIDDDGRAEVKAVQAVLNLLGYGPMNADGFYGPITEKAVRRFQADNGLTVDGDAGPVTRAALYSGVPRPAAKPERNS